MEAGDVGRANQTADSGLTGWASSRAQGGWRQRELCPLGLQGRLEPVTGTWRAKPWESRGPGQGGRRVAPPHVLPPFQAGKAKTVRRGHPQSQGRMAGLCGLEGQTDTPAIQGGQVNNDCRWLFWRGHFPEPSSATSQS